MKDSDFDTPVNIALRAAVKRAQEATPEETVAVLVRIGSIPADFAPEAIRRLHAADAKKKLEAEKPVKKPRRAAKKAKA